MKKIIYDNLKNTPHNQGDRLPSVRELMNSFSAASGTVQAALRMLSDEGLVCKIQGKGCFWGNTAGVIPPIRKNAAERLREKFDNDWERGVLKPDEDLPSIKELAYRYGVSPSLLRQLLKKLEANGIVTRRGRTFSFAQKDISRNYSQILFVTRCNSWGGFTAESEREMDFLKYVYRTAGKENYKLTLLGLHEPTGQLIDRNGKSCQLSDFPKAVGAILSTLLVQKPVNLLQVFFPVKFPVAVWWEHPESSLPPKYLAKQNWAFFNSTFGETPGFEMAKYLILRGIQRVVYISPYHSSSWSIDRLSGLRNCSIGERQLQVIEVVNREMASPWDFRQAARQRVEKESVETCARQMLLDKVRQMTREIDSSIPWVCVNDEVAGLLIEMAERKEIQLPPKIYAYDNSAESYLLQLDSFDFNTESLVKQIFFYLGNSSNISGRGFRHIVGNVVEK